MKKTTTAVETTAPAPTTIPREELIKAVSTVLPAVESKTSIPILASVLIEAKDGAMTFTATNLEIALITRIQCDGEMKVVVPARQLLHVLRALPKKAELTLSAEAKKEFRSKREYTTCALHISAGNFSGVIEGMDVGTFPNLPLITGEIIQLPAAPLRRMIRQTVKAISQEESRFTLNGARLTTGPQGMEIASTDGHRLHLADEACMLPESKSLIPREALALLGPMCKGQDLVAFSHDDNHYFFGTEKVTLITRKMANSKFPDVEKILSQGQEFECALPVAETIAAIASVAEFADSRSRQITVVLGGKKAVIRATALEIGQAETFVECDFEGFPYDGGVEHIRVGLNYGYLLDLLKEASGPSILMRFSPSTKGYDQAADKHLEFSEPGFKAIVMPVRVL